VEGEVRLADASVTTRPASMTIGEGQEVDLMVRVVGDCKCEENEIKGE
jgi:hypothetical protein